MYVSSLSTGSSLGTFSYYALAVIELGQAIKANCSLTSIQSNAR